MAGRRTSSRTPTPSAVVAAPAEPVEVTNTGRPKRAVAVTSTKAKAAQQAASKRKSTTPAASDDDDEEEDDDDEATASDDEYGGGSDDDAPPKKRSANKSGKKLSGAAAAANNRKKAKTAVTTPRGGGGGGGSGAAAKKASSASSSSSASSAPAKRSKRTAATTSRRGKSYKEVDEDDDEEEEEEERQAAESREIDRASTTTAGDDEVDDEAKGSDDEATDSDNGLLDGEGDESDDNEAAASEKKTNAAKKNKKKKGPARADQEKTHAHTILMHTSNCPPGLAVETKPKKEKKVKSDDDNKSRDDSASAMDESEDDGNDDEPPEWFLLKWKHLSHLHSEWVSRDTILGWEDGQIRVQVYQRAAAKRKAGGTLEEQRLAAALAAHASAAAEEAKEAAAAANGGTTATSNGSNGNGNATSASSSSSAAAAAPVVVLDPLFTPGKDTSTWVFDGEFTAVDRVVSHRNVKPNSANALAALPPVSNKSVAYFPEFRTSSSSTDSLSTKKEDKSSKSKSKNGTKKDDSKDQKRDANDLQSDDEDDDSAANGGTQYLIKWTNLHYDQCTWEWASSLLKLPHHRARNRSELQKYWDLLSSTNTQPAVVLPSSSTAINSSLATDGSFPSSVFERKERADREAAEAEAAAAAAEAAGDDADSTTSKDSNSKKPATRTGPRLRTTRKTTKEVKDEVLLPVTKGHVLQKTGLKLRDYQVDGVNWLFLNWSIGRNSILCDEMGLGKTVQCCTLINHLVTRENVRGPVLVVAPLSTLAFWRREIERFTELYAIIYRGTKQARRVIRAFDWLWPADMTTSHDSASSSSSSRKSKSDSGQRRHYKYNVLITSYTYMLMDTSLLQSIPWEAIVVDEAQRLKNSDSKLYLSLSRLKCKRRLLLTGTPIQNNMQELWALLSFTQPEAFLDKEKFLEDYGELKEMHRVESLYGRLRPYVLRRMKSDVEKDLPPKEEVIVEVEMTSVQKKYYRATYEKNFSHLTRGVKRISLLNIAMQLRKVCLHPYLLEGVETAETKDCRGATSIMDRLVAMSGKFVLLDKLLPKLQAEGHRVLIFSQMVRLLDILQDYMAYRKYKFERIDGLSKATDRQAAIDSFNKSGSDRFAFLLSTRAGGLGITLTAADTVIMFDSDWNLQNDIQAQDRCHRIGQTKPVMVYRLLTRRTYEMEMFHRACLKLTLDKIVMTSITSETDPAAVAAAKKRDSRIPFDKKEVEEMLKNGAYSILSKDDEAEKAIKQFAEEDINVILGRSEKIRYTPGKKVDHNSFSKATFVPSGSDQAIKLDDPDFWKKIGLADLSEPDPETTAQLLTTKRQRKAVALYDPHTGELKQRKKADTEDNLVCEICQLADVSEKNMIIICDTCDREYHLRCLNPPLAAVPAGEWHCSPCMIRRSRRAKGDGDFRDSDEDSEDGSASDGDHRGNDSDDEEYRDPKQVARDKERRANHRKEKQEKAAAQRENTKWISANQMMPNNGYPTMPATGYGYPGMYPGTPTGYPGTPTGYPGSYPGMYPGMQLPQQAISSLYSNDTRGHSSFGADGRSLVGPTSSASSTTPAPWSSTVTSQLPRVMDELPAAARQAAQLRMTAFGAALRQREQQLAEYLERELQKLMSLQRTLLQHYGSRPTADQSVPPEQAAFEREVAQQRADNAAQQRELKEQIIDIRKQIQQVLNAQTPEPMPASTSRAGRPPGTSSGAYGRHYAQTVAHATNTVMMQQRHPAATAALGAYPGATTTTQLTSPAAAPHHNATIQPSTPIVATPQPATPAAATTTTTTATPTASTAVVASVETAKSCARPTCGQREVPGAPAFMICGRCLSYSYCTRECQLIHWKGGHKPQCLAAEKARAATTPATATATPTTPATPATATMASSSA